ncbi:MAG: hypothetical protein QUU85_08150, partial [Candidatus Eisenbacteria bacterium]|nr:hypothetical protein [Candidatus Eisenbacteria bacterium]
MKLVPKVETLAAVALSLLISTAASWANAPAPAPGLVPASDAEAVPGEVILQLANDAFLSPSFDPLRLATGRTGLVEVDRALALLSARAIQPVFDLSIDPSAKGAAGMDRIFL